MRKGIFTKDVEDQAAIAKRLSHAVADGFAGTIAMASQSAQMQKERASYRRLWIRSRNAYRALQSLLRAFQRADDRNPDDGSAV